MASVIWEWEIDDMAMSEEERRERHNEQSRNWYNKVKGTPELREINLKAVKRYQEKKMEEDRDAFIEARNKASRESMRRHYKEKKAAMTEEEIQAERERVREAVRRSRAKKKRLAAEAAAKQASKNNE